jgi:hypothetical protein
MTFQRKFDSLYDRMIANAIIDAAGCWIWQGSVPNGYPKISVRRPSKKNPACIWVHRLMLEEFWEIEFPGMHAGHLCNNSACINPLHLEVQTASLNLALRRGYGASSASLGKPMIPMILTRPGTPAWRDFSDPPKGKPVPRAWDAPTGDPAGDDDIPWDRPGVLHREGEPIPF